MINDTTATARPSDEQREAQRAIWREASARSRLRKLAGLPSLRGQPKPPNDYRIEGAVAFVRLRRRGRSAGPDLWAIVDTEDLQRILYCGSWSPSTIRTPTGVVHYVKCVLRGVKPRRSTYLHRVVMEAEPHQLVDHGDGNPLNCCKWNLRRTTPGGNGLNRREHRQTKVLRATLIALLLCGHNDAGCPCRLRAWAVVQMGDDDGETS